MKEKSVINHNIQKPKVQNYRSDPKFSDIVTWANSADTDQKAPLPRGDI